MEQGGRGSSSRPPPLRHVQLELDQSHVATPASSGENGVGHLVYVQLIFIELDIMRDRLEPLGDDAKVMMLLFRLGNSMRLGGQ